MNSYRCVRLRDSFLWGCPGGGCAALVLADTGAEPKGAPPESSMSTLAIPVVCFLVSLGSGHLTCRAAEPRKPSRSCPLGCKLDPSRGRGRRRTRPNQGSPHKGWLLGHHCRYRGRSVREGDR